MRQGAVGARKNAGVVKLERGPIIRALTERDSITELTELLHAAYAALGQLGFNYTAVDQTEDVTRSRIAHGECYVIAEGGRLVATILFSRTPHGGCAWYKQPHVAVINQFAVLPSHQNRGLGKKLMAFAEQRARETQATELALDTSEGAHQLIGWYQRQGYRPVDHVQWDGKTYRSVILSKSLGPLISA